MGVLFRCRVRGTNREGDRVRRSLNWAFARRADLVLTESELVCGICEQDDAVRILELLVGMFLSWKPG